MIISQNTPAAQEYLFPALTPHSSPLILLFLLLTFPLYAQDGGGDYYAMEGQGITFTGTQESTQQIKTITHDEIERSAAPDVPTLLQEALNLNITSYGAQGAQTLVNVRGFDSQRVAVLIDGAPANSAVTGGFDFSTLDTSQIEKIEVIYGGSDTKYNVSGALGGVINIITKKYAQAGVNVNAEISNTSYLPLPYYDWHSGKRETGNAADLADGQNFNVNTSFANEKYSVRTNIFTKRDGNHFIYKDTLTKKSRRKTGNEFWSAGGGAGFVFELPALSRIAVNTNASYNDYNVPISGYAEKYKTDKNTTVQGDVHFSDKEVAGKNITVEATVSNSLNHDAFDNDISLTNALQAINRWSFFLSEEFALRAGADWRYNYYDSDNTGKRERHDFGIYITEEYSPIKKFMLVVSLKLVSDTLSFVPVPKSGWVWYVLDAPVTLTVKNNYFRSFKFPDFEDMYYNAGGYYGNPDLKPEDGWGGDLGAEFKYKAFALNGTFFAQYTVDSIHWSNKSGAWRPENIEGGAWFFGVDNDASYTFTLQNNLFKKIVLSLSYQYLQSHLLSYGYKWNDNKRIPYQPEHTLGGSVDTQWKSGSFMAAVHFESTRFSDTANKSRLKPYCLLTVNYSQDVGGAFTVYAVARNALNWSYESFAGYPMPGASLTLGVRYKFGRAVWGRGQL